MSISPVLSRPIDMIGSIILKAGLADESQVSALKAVSGYAKRNGLLGGIATLLHRVWNAFKAVFGQSDWQMANRAFISIADRGLSNIQGDENTVDAYNRARSKLYTDDGYNEFNQLLTECVNVMDIFNDRVVKQLGIFAGSITDRLEVIYNEQRTNEIAQNLRDNFLDTIAFEFSQDKESMVSNLLQIINEVQSEVHQTSLCE
jgi:hypothetical protein